MILPQIRSTFERKHGRMLADLIGRDDPELLRAAHDRLDEEGLDALLDDPRALNALLTEGDVPLPPSVVFYVMVRQGLLEKGIDDRATADYVATLLFAFGEGNRAYRISQDAGEEYHYLVDLLQGMGQAEGREAFLLRSHLGNYSLWLTGLFPDYLESRERRRGAPGIRYYEELGSSGFRLASETREARRLGMEEVLREVGVGFREVRSALNRISDRHIWKGGANAVGRLLRQVQEGGPFSRS